MSDGFLKPLDGKALLIEAVVDRYGERCSDYQAGCTCCPSCAADSKQIYMTQGGKDG